MLETMNEFFKNRLEGYDEHMLSEIEGAKEFYPYTAAQLPMKHGANVLDLGCGTGLELEYYFALNAQASVVGIDFVAGYAGSVKTEIPGPQHQIDLRLLNWGATYSVKAFV